MPKAKLADIVAAPTAGTRASLADIVASGAAEPSSFMDKLARDAGEEARNFGGLLKGVFRPPDESEAVAGAVGPAAVLAQRAAGVVSDAGGPMAVLKGVGSQLWQDLRHPIETFQERPLSMMMDVAGLAQGGAGLASRAGLSGTARVLRGVSAMNPVNAALKGTGAVAGAVAPKMATKARDMMASALKVPDVIRKRNPNVDIPQAALDRRLPVSGTGIARGEAAIGGLENEVGRIVDQSPATVRLSRRTMPGTVQEVRDARTLSAADPGKAAYAPDRMRQFLTDPNISTEVPPVPGVHSGYHVPKDLPLRNVQDMKVRLGQMSAQKMGQATPNLPEVEMNKAIRNDLKDVIAGAEPRVSAINAELGPRYAVQDAIEHRVPVAERANQLPMKAAVGALTFGNLGGATGKVAGMLIGMAVDSPEYLSRAAISMNAASQRMQGLSRTAKALAPYASMETFARMVTDPQPPTDEEARKRGQIATTAVHEVTEQPGFALLSITDQMKAIDRAVTDVHLLTGGTADATKTKDRAVRLLTDLHESHATERP